MFSETEVFCGLLALITIQNNNKISRFFYKNATGTARALFEQNCEGIKFH